MVDFIMIPSVIGICVFGFYKFVELLVHRKERLMMVEKFSDGSLMNKEDLDRIFASNGGGSQFMALRFGALFAGIGAGLLIGFLIAQCYFGMQWVDMENSFRYREAIGIVYGASTLIFGGFGLLLSFVVEQKIRKMRR